VKGNLTVGLDVGKSSMYGSVMVLAVFSAAFSEVLRGIWEGPMACENGFDLEVDVDCAAMTSA